MAAAVEEALERALTQLGGHPEGYVAPAVIPEDSHPGGALGYFVAMAKFDRR